LKKRTKKLCLLPFQTVPIVPYRRQQPGHERFLLLFFKKEVVAWLGQGDHH